MSSKRKHIGEKLSMLSKTVGISQTALADKVGVPPSQINRFFKGHSDIYSSALIEILKELGFDIEAKITKRLKSVTEVEHADPKSTHEVLNFLFDELDELGKQTYMSQLLWAAKLSSGDAFPKKIEAQIKNEMNLI